MILGLIVSAITFGCATYLALELASAVAKSRGRAARADAETIKLMRVLFPLASAVVGAMLASYATPLAAFGVVGLVCASLAMATWSEVVFGVVDDLVVLVPLAVLLGLSFVQHEIGQIAASLLLAVPFVVLAAMTRGKGIARTDIELAALGGALLGFKFGIAAFVVALLAAFFVNFSKRGKNVTVELTPTEMV
jgi:hypothetical protein